MFGNFDDKNDGTFDSPNAPSEGMKDSGNQESQSTPKKWAWEAEKKYLGMTVPQLAVVGGMALALLVILGCGGWLVLSGVLGPPEGGYVPTSTPTVRPTVTPLVYGESSPIPEPTITFTPVPYEQLIPPGWNQYKTSLIEIWAPSNFKLADKKQTGAISPEGNLELMLSEKTSKSSAYNMFVVVSFGLLTDSNTSVDDQIEVMSQKSLENQIRITERKAVLINSRDARRLILEYKCGTVDCNSVLYVLKDGNTMWFVQYIAEITEFYANLPLFEQSIQTFRLAGY